MRKQTLQTRTNIKKAAAELFSQKGYESTSISDIASLSGSSVGAFYRQFKTKQDVAAEVYEEETIRVIQESIRACEKCTDIDSFIDALVYHNIKSGENKILTSLFASVHITSGLRDNVAEYAFRYRSMIKSKLSIFAPKATEDNLWLCAKIIHTLLGTTAYEDSRRMLAMTFSENEMRMALKYLVEMCCATSDNVQNRNDVPI